MNRASPQWVAGAGGDRSARGAGAVQARPPRVQQVRRATDRLELLEQRSVRRLVLGDRIRRPSKYIRDWQLQLLVLR